MIPYINFKTIGDYIILICYYLKLLKVSKTEDVYKRQIRTGNVKPLSIFLQASIDEGIDEDSERQAKELLSLIHI